MKENNGLVILVVVFFVIFIAVCGVAIYQELRVEASLEEQKNKEINNVNEEVIVYDVNDKEILELVSVFNVLPMLDNDELLNKVFANKDVKVSELTDEQKMYLALTYYMYSNHIEVDSCDYENYEKVNKDKLTLIKDTSYLDNINSLTDVVSGMYTYKVNADEVNVCFSIFGFEGPYRYNNDLEVVSAYMKGDKLYINTKFIRYEIDDSIVTDEEIAYYKTYDANNSDVVIEKFSESFYGSNFNPDLSKYGTYQFVFNVEDGKYYFDSINYE